MIEVGPRSSDLFVAAVKALRTDEPTFTADATTDLRWREHSAGHHQAKRKTNQSKNKAVFEMLTFGISYWLFIDVSFVG